MSVIQLDLQPVAHPLQTQLLYEKFMPAMGNHYGYQLGYLSGVAEKRDESFIYQGDCQALSVNCPLFPEYRPALSFSVKVLEKPYIEYSMAHRKMTTGIANRLALVTLPDEDNQFSVLLVQSGERNPEGTDDVVDLSYDYNKSLADPSGSFNMIMTTIVAFLTKGDTTDV